MTGARQLPRVVFLDRDTLSPETRLRAPAFPHRMEVFAKTASVEVAERIRTADIVITNKVPSSAKPSRGRRTFGLLRSPRPGPMSSISTPVRSAASLS